MAAAAAAGSAGAAEVSATGSQQLRDQLVDRVQLLMSGCDDAAEGWNKCWEEEVTPWDLGQPTPALLKLVDSSTLPTGNALVPGCGAGHDVVALSSPVRFVVGLDVSESAVRKARERASSSPNGNMFAFLKANFFTWEPPELFNLIYDYTFFCALDPSVRPAWARRMGELLKPDGELITLMYLPQGQEAGPPFNTTVADYEEVLKPLGFEITSLLDNELAVGLRKGKEKVGRWKRITT